MKNPLANLPVNRKSGNERFVVDGRESNLDLLGFWQWSGSDLTNNAFRGMLAEYIVACDLGLADKGIRTEWDAFDLVTVNGVKVEVKSSAYLQSWHQTKLSRIEFSICSTKGWDAKTNTYADERARQADVYVFCLLNHLDKSTINPLDMSQWEFFVLPTTVLNTNVPFQKKIGLATLLKLNPSKVRFGEIGTAVDRLLGTQLE